MSKIIFLNDVELRAGGKYRVQALRTGTWEYATFKDGQFSITPEIIREVDANFKAGYKGKRLPVDGPSRGGDAHSKNEAHDCGWVVSTEVSPDGQALYCYLDITNPEVKALVDEGSLGYCSVEMDFEWKDPESRQKLVVLDALSLTNRPLLRNMEPISAVDLSEAAAQEAAKKISLSSQGEGGKQEAKVADQTPEQLTAQIESLKAQLKEAESKVAGGTSVKMAELEVKLAETQKDLDTANSKLKATSEQSERTAREIRLRDIKDKLLGLVRAGKCTRPMYDRVLSLSETLLIEGKSVVKLSEPRKLSAADDAPKVDEVDIVDELLASLEEIPDSLVQDTDADVRCAENPFDKQSKANSSDPLERYDARAKVLMKENPKLDYSTAMRMAEKELAGGAR